MECVNCGIYGHTFRDCTAPVMSFGICAIKFIDSAPHYLLVRRRDSLCYMEFLRGKYKLDKIDYITLLINGMTVEERGRLLVRPFEKLWSDLWNGQNTRQFRTEFENARRNFENLKTNGDSNGKTLSQYIETCTQHFTEAEWGFPKGRRALREREEDCALREFKEETGIPSKFLTLLDEPALVEEYVGTNNIPYKQTYFIACCKPNIIAMIQPNNHVMKREIGDIGWFKFEDALVRIRESNPHKRAVLTELDRRVREGDLREKLATVLEWESS